MVTVGTSFNDPLFGDLDNFNDPLLGDFDFNDPMLGDLEDTLLGGLNSHALGRFDSAIA